MPAVMERYAASFLKSGFVAWRRSYQAELFRASMCRAKRSANGAAHLLRHPPRDEMGCERINMCRDKQRRCHDYRPRRSLVGRRSAESSLEPIRSRQLDRVSLYRRTGPNRTGRSVALSVRNRRDGVCAVDQIGNWTRQSSSLGFSYGNSLASQLW